MSQNFTAPAFSRALVKKAGEALVDTEYDKITHDKMVEVIDNWRLAHQGPLAHINMFARRIAGSAGLRFVIVQRLKRTPSIRHKLDRFRSMNLARMQDIGGCRIVLNSLPDLRRFQARLEKSKAKHKLHSTKDYINTPKESGYRGIHCIYKYHSDTHSEHSGLQIELQIRTTIQHIWATSVETVGTFVRSPLKSSIGPNEWLNFFELLSKVFAHKELNRKTYMNSTEFLAQAKELGRSIARNDIIQKLDRFNHLIKHIETKGARSSTVYVLHLKPSEGKTTIYDFKSKNIERAMEWYSHLENDMNTKKGDDVVLVRSDSINELKKAYPNYFMDTRKVISELNKLQQYTK